MTILDQYVRIFTVYHLLVKNNRGRGEGLINFLGGGLVERGGLFERRGLIGDLRQIKDLTESASWSKRNLFVLSSCIDTKF